jgi:3-deoxy-D-manno-octulosonic-acid transferase
MIKYLKAFTHFYLQDENSMKNLKSHGFTNATVAGDTRFDRVLDIASSAKEIDSVKAFAEGKKVLVTGSTWEPDEDLLAEFFRREDIKALDLKIIIAPHHVESDVIDRIQKKFPGSKRYSQSDLSKTNVVIIDNIGMLSSLYRYGQIAYVGGGFGKAVHNVLEPAAYSIPVFFGPENKKFREIILMKEQKLGFEINNATQLADQIISLMTDASKLADLKARISSFMRSNSGAVKMICDDLKKYL